VGVPEAGEILAMETQFSTKHLQFDNYIFRENMVHNKIKT